MHRVAEDTEFASKIFYHSLEAKTNSEARDVVLDQDVNSV
jgi:hypothetical protein